MSLKIIGIALEDVLSFHNSITDAPGFRIELCEAGGQVLGGGISVDGLAVFLDGLIGQLGAPVHRDLLFVHMGQRVVIIGRGLVHLAGSGLRGLGVRRRLRFSGFGFRRCRSLLCDASAGQ